MIFNLDKVNFSVSKRYMFHDFLEDYNPRYYFL